MSPGRSTDPVVLGIDIGTTWSKGVVCRADGMVVARARRRHDVERPAPGWAEHDAESVWWGETVDLCRELVAELGAGARIQALAVTTCGPCIVPVDAAGRPLRRGILYGIDTRATDEIERLERRLGASRRSGRLPLTSQSIGPKLAWVIRHEPDVARRTALWHTATSFVVERLTGEAVIDHHQASYFGPFIDARRRTWDLRYAEPAEAAMLDGRLPARAWPGAIAGRVTASAALHTGLPTGIRVLVGTSDGPMEALAVGATVPGVAAITHGSTTTLTTFARPRRGARGLWLTDGLERDRPCLGAGLTTTGATLAWISRTVVPELDLDAAHEVLGSEAAASPPGARGLMVVPTFGGQTTPVDDPAARGMIAGLDLGHTRGDLYRATLEGIAFGVRALLEAFEANGVAIGHLRATGGGSRSRLAVQIVSDVTGRPQDVAADGVGAAVGAARLAADATAFSAPTTDWFTPAERIRPDSDVTRLYNERYDSFRRLIHHARQIDRDLARGRT